MKKIALLISISIAICATVCGQSIGPATLNAAGGTTLMSGNEYDWSIGEMTMVSTFTTASIIVTQGLLQPAGNTNEGVANHSLLSDQLQVFPNPATSVVNIKYSSPTAGKLDYRLIDMYGQVVCTESVVAQEGVTTAQVSVEALACASYMLEITVKSENTMPQTMSYKIQKLN